MRKGVNKGVLRIMFLSLTENVMFLCQNFEKFDLFFFWGDMGFVVAQVHLGLHQPWLKVDKMMHKR
jgi:hypothetical protein